MDINAANLRSIYTSTLTLFNAGLEAVKPLYPIVAMTVKSTTSANEYPKLDDLPGIREWVGDRIVNSLSARKYTIENRTFEGTIGLSRDQIEDDQVGLLSPIASQFGQSAGEFPDSLIFPLFKNGDKMRCYDDQYFFDADHPGFGENGEEISVSNITKGDKPAWYLIDDTKVIKPMIFQERRPFKLVVRDKTDDPNTFEKNEILYGVDGRCNAGYGLWQLAHKATVELNADNYAKVRAAMTTIRKRNGQVINIRPTKLLVPPNLVGAARQLLLAENIEGSTNVWRNTAEPVEIPLLA